jgi:hypothetical protein
MSIIPMIHDENEFLILRQKLLDQPTVNEDRQAATIAKKIDYNNIPSNINPLVKAKLLKRRERANSIMLHYTHDKSFSHYKRIFHQIWNDTFYNTPIQIIKLIVGTRNSPNLSKELIHRNPFNKNKKTNTTKPNKN